MISKPVMQNTVDTIASIAGRKLCVYDTDGQLIACSGSGESAADKRSTSVRQVAGSAADIQEIHGELYFRIMGADQPEYVLVLDGTDELTRTLGRMAAFQLSGLAEAYRDRFDEEHFYKNLLLDNLLLVDIGTRAGKLHIPEKAERICLVIRFDQPPTPEISGLIQSALADGDILTQIDANNTVIIHVLADSGEETAARKAEIREYSEELIRALESGGAENFRISSGSPAAELKHLSQSYKEARMALDVSRVFYPNARVVSYSELGLGRLIYQLPLSLCQAFLRDTFGDYQPGQEEEEIRQTVDAFFRNNLSFSEAARELFIHRNTLIYRLEKIQKQTGLDIRVLEDALTYRVAMMVVSYMKYMEA
ncbi:MAG: helix-turn-helix domain-containing protein [Lachnospiraceae bacterium]|nr:helix-turn-helix domain-containing protein [Lachnospiraceae bacterium]